MLQIMKFSPHILLIETAWYLCRCASFFYSNDVDLVLTAAYHMVCSLFILSGPGILQFILISLTLLMRALLLPFMAKQSYEMNGMI